jgi:hypothetical protein
LGIGDPPLELLDISGQPLVSLDYLSPLAFQTALLQNSPPAGSHNEAAA